MHVPENVLPARVQGGRRQQRWRFLRNRILCARSEDVRRSQSAVGRFWRNPAAAVQGDPLNAFSRDMLMGVFDYLLATRDRGAMERFYAYLGRNGNKMCPKATDNRCRLVPGTWGLFGMVMRSLGIPRPFLIRAAEKTVEADLLLASTTVPPGYQMQLVSHHLMVRRAMGQDTPAMRWAAQHIAKRQPLNPLFRYLADGATEEVAQLTREICQAQRGALAHDVFFQRELARNAEGKIVVLRDWKEPVAPLASDVANGHDCIIVLNSLLSGR